MVAYWYIVNSASGREDKAIEGIKAEAAKRGLESKFLEFVAPVDSGGKSSKKRVLPGYIFIKMILDDSTLSIIKSVAAVSKMLGSGKNPARVPESEVVKVLSNIDNSVPCVDVDSGYRVGGAVLVKDGPFETFTGEISEIYQDKKRLKVLVSILGREIPVELEFWQVSKV